MKFFIFFTFIIIPISIFAVQNIDLAGQLPPNTTVITGNAQNQYFGYTHIGKINEDASYDLAVYGDGKIFIFLGQVPLNQTLSANQANFIVSKTNNYLDFKIIDLNADGSDDLIFHGQLLGKIFILLGGNKLNYLSGEVNIDSVADVVILRNIQDDSFVGFGEELAFGDVNNDNINDLAISSYNNLSGRVYLLYGQTVFSDTINLNLQNSDILINLQNQNKNLFIKDINNDLFDDILIGEYQGENLNSVSSGRVTIFYGKNNLPSYLVKP